MPLSIVLEEEISAFANWLDTACRSFDLAVFKFFASLHTNWLTPIVNVFTQLGDTTFVVILMIVGLVLCFSKKTRKYGMTLFFAIFIGTLITNVVLKPLIFRPRPYVSLADNADFMQWYTEAGSNVESDRSFPSGHTTAAFEIATALFLVVKNKKIKWIFPVYAVLIGCSRLYLMVHYCTDVLAGMICGIIAGVLAYFITRAIINWLQTSDKKAVQRINNIDLFFKNKNTEDTAS
ncbi:MAG: phosphatase PAP2 family protein [Clostridiales bacterium]|nr:phosphatase PAP2 family protein [Clostridiales bacterium]